MAKERNIWSGLFRSSRSSSGQEPLPAAQAQDLFRGSWLSRLRGHHRGYRRFILHCHARSGSNMLQSAFLSHPQVELLGEVLHRDSVVMYPEDLLVPAGAVISHPGAALEHRKSLEAARAENPLEFVQEKIFSKCPRSVKALGFKVFPEHLRPQEMQPIRDWLKAQQDVAVIHLYRDNLLAYMVSFTAAKASGKWLITSSDERAARKLTIDPKEAERLFEQRVRQRDRLKEDFAGHPLLEVTYEALC